MLRVLSNTDSEIIKNIEITKSDSSICGEKLRSAHYYLGKRLAEMFVEDNNVISKKILVVAMMRSGLILSLALSDVLERNNKVQLCFSNQDCLDTIIAFGEFDYILIADGVINTGHTIIDFIKDYKQKNLVLMTNVMYEKTIEAFDMFKVYTSRLSKNHYIGAKTDVIQNGFGPDTSDRLFSNFL